MLVCLEGQNGHFEHTHSAGLLQKRDASREFMSTVLPQNHTYRAGEGAGLAQDHSNHQQPF